MRPHFAIVASIVASLVLVPFQSSVAKPKKTEEPAQEAAAKAEESDQANPDPESAAPSSDEKIEDHQEKPVNDAEPPPLVTVAPPDDSATEPAPKSGVEIRVEEASPKQSNVDPAKIKLLAPYPAKPLAKPPTGWKFDTTGNTTPFVQEVEIASGAKIPLSIKPHLLVPEADGVQVFSIAEPGYESALGYQQTSTIGAILSNSILQLDESSKQLGASIDQLQQLLISLPKSESQAERQPANFRKK
jgi:hypothetical protein